MAHHARREADGGIGVLAKRSKPQLSYRGESLDNTLCCHWGLSLAKQQSLIMGARMARLGGIF